MYMRGLVKNISEDIQDLPNHESEPSGILS